ncbi:MAG TPA: hypothetical protein VGO47_11755 [Chlamydiales bacterium]|nr:hypothetical protein [Chlamydiales bacterium]
MTTRLPEDIILAILEEIDEPRDLLSLALCNHFFKRIIIPLHLDFRHIRYDENKASLWRYLVDRPVLAARLRKLEVIYCGPVSKVIGQKPRALPGRKRFPKYTDPSVDIVCDLIYAMFPLLDRLRRFVWIPCRPNVLNLLETFSQQSLLRELHLEIWASHYDYLPACQHGSLHPNNKPMIGLLCFRRLSFLL